MDDSLVFSVTQLNDYIKELMDCDQALNSLFVRGEISNYKAYPSGHHYFSLKDETGALKCVMFKREALHLRFRPENGMKIIALGRVTVFPRDGQYQLYCTQLVPDGVGELHTAFEQLKTKLAAEGLFAENHKKPLPQFPQRIALITSSAGAAVRDMIRILGARWPMAEVFILPVRVQGTEAAGEISHAIRYANDHRVADLIITGRGGGSMEDLWAFNEEVVARAIFSSEIPIISAVGHEPDVTIADFVADVRAATPSNAAELAVPDQNELAAALQENTKRLSAILRRRLETTRSTLDRLSRSRALTDPLYPIAERRMLLDHQTRRLSSGLSRTLSGSKERCGSLAAKLDALSPLKVLGRGYAIPRLENGAVVRSVSDVAAGDTLNLTIADGAVTCQVAKTHERLENNG
ncbi:MAG: exodeoxyribonuclease VII large subunit [Oscillospiraceae bacterium]